MANDDQNNNEVDRVEIEAVLIEVDFPATRDEMVMAAHDTDASDNVIILFESLPDTEYATREDADRAINEHTTTQRK
jgi:hypothetical protein